MRLFSPCLMLAPVALLFSAGCERTTGFCQTTADCTAALQCSPVTSTCQPALTDMAMPTYVPRLGAPVLAPSGLVPGDTFGYAMAASGPFAVFGSHLAQGTRGIAHVCNLTSAGCLNLAPLPAPDVPTMGDYYGVAVAAAGNTIAVGAYNKDLGKGAVYVYVNNGAVWVLSGKVTPPTTEAVTGDFFGIAVSLGGEYLVVGANNKDTGKGAVYSFLRAGPGVFTYNARLPAPGDAPLVGLDYFGLQVATAAGVVAVGAPGRLGGKGAVYVYRHDLVSKQPIQYPELTLTGAPGEQLGGSALALSPTTLAVGSPLYTPNPQSIDTGTVYLLDVAVGGKPLMLPISAPRPRQRVGFSLALAAAGAVPETLIIGAPGREQALLYRRSDKTWLPAAALDVPNEFNRSGFGSAVATTGTQHVVGLRGLPQDTGAAFVFTDN